MRKYVALHCAFEDVGVVLVSKLSPDSTLEVDGVGFATLHSEIEFTVFAGEGPTTITSLIITVSENKCYCR